LACGSVATWVPRGSGDDPVECCLFEADAHFNATDAKVCCKDWVYDEEGEDKLRQRRRCGWLGNQVSRIGSLLRFEKT
jgi:hypothetical protein